MASDILFDVLRNILQLKSQAVYDKHIKLDDFEKSFNRYMVIRYLSMGPIDAAKIVLENQVALERMPSNKVVYKFLLMNIPKQKSSFIKYIK